MPGEVNGVMPGTADDVLMGVTQRLDRRTHSGHAIGIEGCCGAEPVTTDRQAQTALISHDLQALAYGLLHCGNLFVFVVAQIDSKVDPAGDGVAR
ncbi:hypothetical protein D3C86_1694260 [compost metagenome]